MPDQANGSDSRPPNPRKDFFVVGIGASAGGISALREFFSHVPSDSGMAYVVIMHLSPQHESNISSVLQNHCAIRVTEVTQNVRVEPNHVYVIPPTKYLVMEHGAIRLAEPERPRGGHTSIDLFFRTLAQSYGKDAVAIVLSGTGADGTIGLGRIKEEGGFVIAQEPSEAEYSDMPRSAIGTELVDIVLPVAEMADKLVALRDGVLRLPLPLEHEEKQAPDFDEGVLREILTLVRLRTGNEFQQYKRPTLLRRITRRMQVNELSDSSGYLTFLREHPEEVPALMRDLLITVTSFFRDHDSFEFLEHEVIPQLFVGKGSNDQVRVWSVGCATGEEAYSLAMLLAEYRARLGDPPRVQVFATDIDDRAIAQARDCRYPSTISLDVSPERLRHFFIREGDHYLLKKELRETVLFASHNVLRDPPFSKLDLISCRNLLIYLNRDMQERTLEIFHFALRSEGYLFLGGSESAEMVPTLFNQVDKKRRVYRRRPAIGMPGATPSIGLGKWQSKLPPPPTDEAGNVQSAGKLHEEVVEEFAPPSILVNEDFDVVHLSAHAGRYLRLSGGELSRNLLKLVLPDLRLDLRAALLEAKNIGEGVAAESPRVAIEIEGQKRSINLSVRKVAGNPEAARGFLLVIFDEAAATAGSDSFAARATPQGLELVRQMEQELQRTKDQLRLTVEQYETSTEELRASNEELQAINEELRSATEELETSKEELQSVNEELTTVNQEYREKIDEIGRANADLQNLMASTDIGTIFLDRSMRIKLFTQPAQQLFNITAVDVGRPLQHFSHKLDYNSLIPETEEVLRTLQATEREVRSRDDNWYLTRMAPYRTLDDKIDGVVLTFVDITGRKRSEEQLRRQAETLSEQANVFDLAHVMFLDAGRRITMWNAGCESLYGYTNKEALGKNAHDLLKTEFDVPRGEIDAQLQKTGQWQGELTQTTRAGNRIIVASHWILSRREAGSPAVILEVNNEITPRRVAKNA